MNRVFRAAFNASKRFASSSSSSGSGEFKQKTFKEVWLGDKGAYPIMAGIGFCICYTSSNSLYYLIKSPDVNLTKSKSEFMRGAGM
jgi:hypothetical protein